MPVTTGQPGKPLPLFLNFFDETTGLPADPVSVTLDITYGTEVGLVADVAGPFAYSGASVSTSGQVWRIAQGQFAFTWIVPLGAADGVYVANWTCSYGGQNWLGIENFVITGGSVPVAVPSGDVGYWTGGLIYGSHDIEFGTTDSDGITWLWKKLEGWDGPDVTGGLLPRAGDHGAWPSTQFFQPRTLTLTVQASAPTQALRDRARSKLSAAVPVSDLGLLRYDEPIPKQAQVRRSGRITETYPTLTDVQFVIGLVAPDPRKYSTVLSQAGPVVTLPPTTGVTYPVTYPLTWPPGNLPGALVMTNSGDFETRPEVTIQGPVTGPVLLNTATGQSISWSTVTLGSSDVLVVDFADQQAHLNGSYRPADASSFWWTLPPGTTTLALQANSNPGATISASWRDAYM